MTWDPPSRRRRRHRGHGRTVPSPSHSFFSPTVQDRGKKSGKAIVMEIPLVSGRGVTILDWTLNGHIFQKFRVRKRQHGKSNGPELSSDDSEESRDRPTSILPHPRPHRCWTVKLSRGDAGERDCDSAWQGRKCLRTAFFGERKTVFNNSPLIVSHAAV